MNDNFLTYMPFEQFNNQLISLRCACGMARLLNRTLVLPEIGYNQNRAVGSTRLVYEPTDYRWQPLSCYFNTTHMMNHIPCKTVPFSAYYGETRSIHRIYYRRLGARYNRRTQPESYYYHIAGMLYLHHRSLPNHLHVYLNSTAVTKHFADYGRSLKHFALGNVFWMYTFDADLRYPQTRYVDIYEEGVDSYKQITDSFVFADRLQRLVVDDNVLTGAVHWRRGDYRAKCAEELYPSRCFPTFTHLLGLMASFDPLRRIHWTILSNKPTHRLKLFLISHNFTLQHLKHPKGDPIEMAIVDQMVAVKSTIFIGNMYSSFTRTIADKRRALNLTTHFF